MADERKAQSKASNKRNLLLAMRAKKRGRKRQRGSETMMRQLVFGARRVMLDVQCGAFRAKGYEGKIMESESEERSGAHKLSHCA